MQSSVEQYLADGVRAGALPFMCVEYLTWQTVRYESKW